MCNKLFAVVLVLGLVSSAVAGVDGDMSADLIIHYTMDAADGGMPGPGGTYQMNSGGSLGPGGNGLEQFKSSDGIDYGPGLFNEALYISNDGVGPDPCASAQNLEMGDYIDIPASPTEALLAPFENRTVSLWFRENVMIDPAKHIGQWNGPDTFLVGSHWRYYCMIKLEQDEVDPGVAPDILKTKLGGKNNAAIGVQFAEQGWIPINLGEWHHVAVTLRNYGDPCDIGNNMQVATYFDGALVAKQGQCTRFSQARGGVLTSMEMNVGAYNEGATYFYQIPDGADIDDFAILDMALDEASINGIYQRGLAGVAIPEPATIALLGLGGLALLRRKR